MDLPAERGRQTELSKSFGVNPKAARKWLLGIGYPEMSMAVRLANWGNVNLTWLLQGAGPKRGNRIDTRALVLDDAVQSLSPELAGDLIDSLRAKLTRIGKISVQEPRGRYAVMLDSYAQDIERKRH
jgi:hypothetical protein